MLVSEALTLIQGHGGFDPSVAQTSDTMQRAWLSQAVREAVAQARWLRQRRLFGPTVIGTSDYAVDPDVIWVKSLRVGSTRPWARTQLEKLWTAEELGGVLVNAPGAYAPMWEEEAGTDVEDVPKYVRIWPTPTAAGLKVEALCAVNHKPIVAGTSSSYVLQVPDDLAFSIVRGAVGIGITLVHERADLAAPHLAAYTDAKAQLKKRAESLVGQGVQYVAVRGR